MKVGDKVKILGCSIHKQDCTFIKFKNKIRKIKRIGEDGAVGITLNNQLFFIKPQNVLKDLELIQMKIVTTDRAKIDPAWFNPEFSDSGDSCCYVGHILTQTEKL